MRSTAERSNWLGSVTVRKWAIRVVVVLLAFEVVYVLAANALLRTGKLTELINKKPEKTTITWESAATYLPGFVKVSGFELRSQTRKDQVYLRVAGATARISLLQLPFKTIHVRGVDAADVDFRYRERLDRPAKPGHEDEVREPPAYVEYFPEIPDLSNPPDPKPEDLYPRKRKKHPWTIKITGAEVEGPIRVALNGARLESDGRVGGGVTVKPRKTVEIHRARMELKPAVLIYGPETVSDNLEITADLRFAPFAAKGAKPPDVLSGVSGELAITGQVSNQGAMSHQITPGITWTSAGTIVANLKLNKGIVRPGSEYSLQSDTFLVRLMGLDFTGSATIKSSTGASNRAPLTVTHIGFDDYRVVDAEGGSVAATGTGLELDAEWTGFSVAGSVPASHVKLMVPTTQINDIGVFNALIPEQAAFSFDSGTGAIEAVLEIDDRVAKGNLDLTADEIVFNSGETPVYADLEVHAKLAEGDLPSKRFDITGTTIRLDDIIDKEMSGRKREKLAPWYCDIELQQGEIVFGKPLAAQGGVGLEMYDTRPVTAMLRRLGLGPKWLALAPNIRDVEGTLELAIRSGQVAVHDLDLTGDGFETLGWMATKDKKTDGRIFARFKAVKVGLAIDAGKAKVVVTQPRQWFEDQPRGLE